MFPRTLAAIAILTVSASVSASVASADSYGSWKSIGSAVKKQNYCHYTYTTKTNTQSKQLVVYVGQDRTLRQWLYYYKNEQTWRAGEKPWGRCQNPNHPAFDAKVMKWQRYANGQWNDYPQPGFCPAPKDGKNPILEIPPLPPK